MSIIIKPIISEKAINLQEKLGAYTFLVTPRSNKIEIRNAVEQMYGVKVAEVNTMIYAPEVSSKNTKKGLQIGKTNKLKKAIVKLVQGEVLDIYAN
jgi:large subunit ribosomal protein L23